MRRSCPSVPETSGASYASTISSGGTITAGANSRTVSFKATCNTASVTLSVTVTASCGTPSTQSITVNTSAAVSATLSATGSLTIADGASKSLKVELTGTAPFSVTWSDNQQPSSGSASSFTRTVSPRGTTEYTVTAVDANGCSAMSNQLQVTVTPATPGAFSAIATSTTAVSLSWSAPASIAGDTYYVERRAAGVSFGPDGSTTATTLSRPAGAGAAYLYRVRVVRNGTSSDWSTIDLATTVLFTDVPVGTTTAVKAEHIMQLRTAVNAVRALVTGLGAGSYVDATLTNAAARADHILQPRAALNEARVALELPAWSYSAVPVAITGAIHSSHVNDIRGGVQ